MVTFKDVLEKTKNTYRSNPPREVVDARQTVRQTIPQLKSLGLTPLADRWYAENFSMRRDFDEITDTVREATGSKAFELSTLPPPLGTPSRNRQTAEMARLFDLLPYRPSPEAGNVMNELATGFSTLVLNHQKFAEEAGGLLGAKAAQYT